MLGGPVVGGGLGEAQVVIIGKALFHHVNVVDGLVIVVVDEETVDAGEAGHIAQPRELLLGLYETLATFIGELVHQSFD